MENGIEILLINSNIKEQAIFSFALNNLHVSYTCHFANDAKTAKKILSNNIPDFIFIDEHQPGLNKLIGSQYLKQADDAKKPALIIYADDDSVRLSKKALYSGACMCIHKTRVIAELICTLRSIFAQPVITADAFHN